jgi:FHA domain-containing protein/uncharacterized protein DUF1707
VRGYLRFMVASDSAPSDSLPSVFRVSDEERDEVIRMLRDGSVDGRISNETFMRRVDRALHARGADELAELLADLPPVPDEQTGRAADWRIRATIWLREIRLRWARFRVVMRPPQPPPLILPRGPRTVFTIGRSPACDLPLGDMTVSWHHAELRRTEGAWVLVDVGSTNGTRVNGWRADSGFTVRAGDWVSFGRACFRITDHG